MPAHMREHKTLQTSFSVQLEYMSKVIQALQEVCVETSILACKCLSMTPLKFLRHIKGLLSRKVYTPAFWIYTILHCIIHQLLSLSFKYSCRPDWMFGCRRRMHFWKVLPGQEKPCAYCVLALLGDSLYNQKRYVGSFYPEISILGISI